MDKLRTIHGVVDVDSNFEPTQPELRINVDRARAADLGVNIDSLATNLRTLVGGEEVSEFKDGDDQFIVRLRLDEPYRNNPAGDGRPAGPGRPGHGSSRSATSPRSRTSSGPASIERYNRQRQISVNANIDGVPLGEVLAGGAREGRGAAPEGRATRRCSAAARGRWPRRPTTSSSRSCSRSLFIYMVLASQFNSFVHPLTIMTSLPLSLPAGLLALMAFGMTLNVYSAIGLMMLFGIVKKNSILQVDYTNTLRAQGMERHEALDRRQPRPAAADPDDDDRDHRRHDSDCVRPRRRRRLARVDGGHDHRRPGALPAADAAGHAGRLLVLRRPARVEPDRGDPPRLAAEDRPRRRSRRRSESAIKHRRDHALFRPWLTGPEAGGQVAPD